MKNRTSMWKLLAMMVYVLICSTFSAPDVYAAGSSLPAPSNFRQIGDSEHKMIITWDKVEGAAGYGVSLYQGGWQEPVTVTDNCYSIQGSLWRSVRVCSIDANGNTSDYTSYITALVSPNAEYFCQTKCSANTITFEYLFTGESLKFWKLKASFLLRSSV